MDTPNAKFAVQSERQDSAVPSHRSTNEAGSRAVSEDPAQLESAEGLSVPDRAPILRACAMTHIPRPHPPIWQKICATILLLAAIVGFSVASLMHDEPKGPDPGRCVDDRANPWCPK